MLPPVRPSVPSASLLRFLRSQFGCATGSSASLGPKSCIPSHQTLTTRPRNSSTLVRLGQSRCSAPPSAGPLGGPVTRRKPTALQHLSPSLTLTRHSSTVRRPFLRRLLDFRRSKTSDLQNQRGQSPGVSDDGGEGIFNIGRGLSAKASNELRIRCTEFDLNGDVTLVNGEFRKLELIAKYGLLPRDLRKIDSSTLPHILVRPSAILINLLHLRVLIKADRVLVFDAYGSTDSYMQSLFVYDLEGKLRQKSSPLQAGQPLPYEFRALEAVLISVTAGLEEEFNGIREPVVRVLRALEEDIDRDKLRNLLIYSKKIGTFEQKARLVRDAIDDLLEADDDLAAMYLSERATGREREEDDHQEVEMLLESYHKVCDEIVQSSSNLVTNIRNTEEVVKAILDANRNSLMLLDLKFSIGTLGLATGTLFSALYGMNLKNFIEESDFGFGGVSIACFAISAVVCVYGLAKLRKLQRVRMWVRLVNRGPIGEPIQSSLSGGSLPGEARSDRIKRLRENAAAHAAANASKYAAAAASRSSGASSASAFEDSLRTDSIKTNPKDNHA
ncbi:hypothetical protein N7468_000618 [Penicillium chermesinum]|uniref:Magnesium transporter n=1 Tax=Penicillium chermesinum TaxID=63820 RepID=A0A9W9PKN5_9EURO|nr:uncharacterized protein N7468_000618 [Penicillium chermesinum]KAJ5249167.1 hypothetical protein N7468_000618 [Penicillium chermesinum]